VIVAEGDGRRAARFSRCNSKMAAAGQCPAADAVSLFQEFGEPAMPKSMPDNRNGSMGRKRDGEHPPMTTQGQTPGSPESGRTIMSAAPAPTRRHVLAASAAGAAVGLLAGTVHAAKNGGSGPGVELATYVVEKGKPLVTVVE
jgi:hypothetical protein